MGAGSILTGIGRRLYLYAEEYGKKAWKWFKAKQNTHKHDNQPYIKLTNTEINNKLGGDVTLEKPNYDQSDEENSELTSTDSSDSDNDYISPRNAITPSSSPKLPGKNIETDSPKYPEKNSAKDSESGSDPGFVPCDGYDDLRGSMELEPPMATRQPQIPTNLLIYRSKAKKELPIKDLPTLGVNGHSSIPQNGNHSNGQTPKTTFRPASTSY